jgi:HemY protein
MRALSWLLVVSAAAVAVVVFGHVDDGYALFVYPPYRVEISLLFFAVLLLAAFAVLYAGTRLVRHVLGLPGYVRVFRERRRRDRAQAALAGALQAYFEGRYARAEKEAGAAYEAKIWPGLAALIAARAAHEMRNFGRRDQWFERASGAGDSAQLARLVSQAALALEERNFIGARDALRSLHGSGPKHIATLRMLLRAERGAQNWEEVLRLAAQLAKRDAIAPALAEEYRTQAHIELLARAAIDRTTLAERWRRIPSRERANPRIAAAAARDAAQLGASPLAREILEQGLAAEWSATLVALYGDLPRGEEGTQSQEARVRIERAEKWLREHPEDPQLLSALGRLCARAELWGKAQNYLEASLSFEPTRAAHLELARLYERLDRQADAAAQYRRAAELP